jgi:hypothetical protein
MTDSMTAAPDPRSSSGATVVALVPAKDRADSVGATVEAILALGTVDRVVVVDDGSTDDTGALARAAGAEVLVLPENRGKGGAVLAGVEATPDADVYLLIDADVGPYAAEASALLGPVLEDRADLVIGVLPSPGSRGGFGNVRRLARAGIARACGFDARAPLSGQRAVRARYLRDLEAAGRFGLEVAMTIDAVRAGARVVEVEVAMEHRHTGRSVSGFRHRGAQGLDIVGALWPRLVPRAVRRGLLTLAVLATLLVATVGARAAVPDTVPARGGAGHVVLFGIPDVGLADLRPDLMPNLSRLSSEGALGLATARSGGATSSASVYATIGAGDRVKATPVSGVALGADAPFEGDAAAEVLARRTGTRAEGAVVLPSMPVTLRRAGSDLSSSPGALGDALHEAGLETAVVSNAATVADDGTREPAAPAALAVVDRAGGVDHGTVGDELLRPSARAPYGLQVGLGSFVGSVRRALAAADVVVVDPGETERASTYLSAVAEGARRPMREAALRRTDRVLGAILPLLPADTLLVVTGITSDPSGQLVPIVVHGAGVAGHRVSSPSTKRPDLVAVTDLAPTILDALGVDVPTSMIGQPLRYGAGTVDRGSLDRQNQLVADRDEVYGSLQTTFVWVALVIYVVAAVVLLLGVGGPALGRLVRFALLATLAWPLATFLVRAVPSLYGLGVGSHLLVWAIALALAAGAHRLRSHPLDPLLAIAALTVAVLVADLATGAHLQISSYLGYTPTVAARFVGIGNAAYGVLAGATILTCALVVARSARPRDAWWLAVAVGVVVVVADGAPWMGSDVGGILSLVPALGLLLLALSGRRVGWRPLVLIGLAALALLGVAVGFEALRDPSQRTHLGRFFLGGAGETGFWTTIDRKWAVNVRLLTTSTWSELIPIIGLFTIAVLVVRRGWQRLVPAGSAERAAVLGLAAVAVLGWLTNDSGPIAAAMALVFLGPLAALVAQRGEVRRPTWLAPGPAAEEAG